MWSGCPAAPASDHAAQWIWFPEGSPASSAPPSQRFFHQFELEAEKRVAAAELEMTADNGFQVWINDQVALQGDNFHVVYRADVATMLFAGRNTIRVIATNGADRDNPAGLIGALEIRFADGSQRDVLTDRTWRADCVVESSGVRLMMPCTNRWLRRRSSGRTTWRPGCSTLSVPRRHRCTRRTTPRPDC